MVAIEKSLTILKEIRDYIIPLADEELFQLEKNILAEGCREPLTVWPHNNQLVIVDGHNRFKICQKHHLDFKIRKVAFKNLDEVKLWMVDNQRGRRNLSADQISYYRGLKYLALRNKKGGFQNIKTKGKAETSTSEFLSGQFNVSESTIKRDAKFAEGLNNIGADNPKLKLKILTGESKVKKSDVQALSVARNLKIRNEADLYNKAKKIKEQLLSAVEEKIKAFERNKITQAQEFLKNAEPVFISKEDRLKKIKGMVISAINRAIREKDSNAIKELKRLIDQLQDLLFD